MSHEMSRLFAAVFVFAVASGSSAAAADDVGVAEFDNVEPFIGVFRAGMWYLDANDNHVWDGLQTDEEVAFGDPGDWPVALPAGVCGTQLGVVDGFSWQPRGPWIGGNRTFNLGGSGMIPLMWVASPVVFEEGIWAFDRNIDGIVDRRYYFGVEGDIPVVGAWGGNRLGMGVFDPNTGHWYLDTSGDNAWGQGDVSFQFGDPGDFPVAADFNPALPGDEIGTFSNGAWYIDMNGNRTWNGDAGDATWFFGEAGDIPVILYRCS